MEQSTPFWRPGLTWAEVVARYDGRQGGEKAQPVDAAPAAPVEAPDEEATDRAWRIAALRRAIVLSEVLGPPRALRRGSGYR